VVRARTVLAEAELYHLASLIALARILLVSLPAGALKPDRRHPDLTDLNGRELQLTVL